MLLLLLLPAPGAGSCDPPDAASAKEINSRRRFCDKGGGVASAADEATEVVEEDDGVEEEDIEAEVEAEDDVGNECGRELPPSVAEVADVVTMAWIGPWSPAELSVSMANLTRSANASCCCPVTAAMVGWRGDFLTTYLPAHRHLLGRTLQPAR